MLDSPEEVNSLLSHKLALKYTGRALDAMLAISTASKKRSLAEFNNVCFLIKKFLKCFLKSTYKFKY